MTNETIYYCVYRITNLVEGKHYYGYKSSAQHPKNILGKKYFSSQTDLDFILDQKKNPQNYRYKIVGIFNTKEEALAREIKLHKKFDVDKNDHRIISGEFTITDRKNIKRKEESQETKLKKSLSHTGNAQHIIPKEINSALDS